MQPAGLILAKEFCSYLQIEQSFIKELHHFGLLQVTSTEEADYIPEAELQKLEHIVRLHYDLNINLEGIDAISHLLDRLKGLQSEIMLLRNRLRLYEEFQ